MHVIDANSNQKLDATDALRFYVDKVGDNYNAENVYWLVTGNQAGLRMEQRNVQAAGAQVRSTAYEPGKFSAPTFYDSTMPGYDGDHFFHNNLDTDPDTDDAESVAVTLTHGLPLIGDNSLPTYLTLNVTPYAIGSTDTSIHRLSLTAGGYNYTDDGDDWIVSFSSSAAHQNASRQFTLTKSADQWTITLLKSDIPQGVKLDTVDYLLPVNLNFGGKGARFQGVDGIWRYKLADVPGGRTIYDITNPAAPQQLTLPGDAVEFQDGPTPARYLVSGEGTLVEPRAVVAHSAVNMAAKGGAHALYIAPASFHLGLQPLVNLRTSQNYQVRVVDAQSLV